MEHISFTLIFTIVKTLFSPFVKLLKWIYGKLPFRVVGKKGKYKLGIIESSWRNHEWHYAENQGKKIVVINTYWQITNALPYNLTTCNAFLAKPSKIKGSILIKDVNSQYWGHYSIPKGFTTDAEISFVLDKDKVKNSKDLIKVKIEIQDPLGVIHKVDNVQIHPIIQAQIKKLRPLKSDDLSQIHDPLKKKVISILKNEVQQYNARGRAQGRLGTVDWPTGTIEYRDMNSKIKYLYATSNRENVTSDHVTALIDLYQKSSSKKKKIIRQTLLERIDKQKEYRDVGYLIIFFLFRIGYLQDGLDVSLKKLKGDNANAFGDLQRMLDILLAFNYEDFKDLDLDSIEKFIYKAKGEEFSIKERVNEIRIRRINSAKK